MARVSADRERCVGTGMCVFLAPGAFDQDEGDGRVVVMDPHPGPEVRSAVRRAVAGCPVSAISVQD